MIWTESPCLKIMKYQVLFTGLSLCRLYKHSYSKLLLPVNSYCTQNEKKPWRVPYYQRKGEFQSKFKLFAPEKNPSTYAIKVLQTSFDFRPKTIRRWFLNKKEQIKVLDQRYIPERHDILGSNLAAAHFIVYRGGAVKFVGREDWIRKNEDDEFDLPNKYVSDMDVEAIDASNMELLYEGFQNMTNLKKLKWLSLQNCPYINDWCLDRISGEYQSTLEYLDLSNCPKLTERGLGALYRMNKLQTLKLTNSSNSRHFELACLLLEDLHPNLRIDGVTYIDLN